MRILHRYILSQHLRNLFLCSLIFTFLFLFVDFFDRIDNVLEGEADFATALNYFLLKIPFLFNLTLPVSVLVSTLFTVGLLTRSAELTAMRCSGSRLFWLAAPIFIVGAVVSVLSFLLSETIVPNTQRRVREIYNIDIQKRDKSGKFSREKFWFREAEKFYSVSMFDSRKNSLLGLSIFDLDDSFLVNRRTDADNADWMGESLGWSMENVHERDFAGDSDQPIQQYDSLPLPIPQEPKWFYTSKTDPSTMSFQELKKFIERQEENGLGTKSFMGDLYAKISFPLINFILPLIVIPFAVGSGRSRSLATAAIAAIITGFSYHVVHSISIALARAELWPPLFAAWAANIILGTVGLILFLGAEAPE